ncbi:MAG TPA: RNA polymerase sigma factor [Candidatus Cryosericum sp.]|nr:RNA polymerase sigma factor [Candidatus Cryosericum sp.]
MKITDESPSASFDQIYQRHVDMVYRLCFSYLKNRADTEDAVQATFFKLFQANKEFASTEHEKAWLIVVASNICKNTLMHWWRKKSDIEDCSLLAAPEQQEERELFYAVLALPDRCKTVVYLYYYEGYSTEEIAVLLKRPVSTVRNQLRDARKTIQRKLEVVDQCSTAE